MKIKTQIISCLFLSLPVLGFTQLNEGMKISGKSLGELKIPQNTNYRLTFSSLLSLDFPFPNHTEKNNSIASLSCSPYKGKAHTAFFCRMEDKLEHKVKLPVKMRLGTLDYVERLEQKRTYRYQDWLIDNL